MEDLMTALPVKKNHSLRDHSFMLATIVGVAVLLALSSCASKSRHRHMGPPPMKSPEQIMATMNERLQLTEEQEREVYPIIEELVERQNWAFETYGKRGEKDQKKLMDEMAEIQKSIETQLRNVLTERQMILYQLYHEKEHQKMMGEKGPHSGQHP
jgi:Spy/CpxP family protein refolding chaperone